MRPRPPAASLGNGALRQQRVFSNRWALHGGWWPAGLLSTAGGMDQWALSPLAPSPRLAHGVPKGLSLLENQGEWLYLRSLWIQRNTNPNDLTSNRPGQGLNYFLNSTVVPDPFLGPKTLKHVDSSCAFCLIREKGNKNWFSHPSLFPGIL